MAPIATSTVTSTPAAPSKPSLTLRGPAPVENVAAPGRNTLPKPLVYEGLLDKYDHFELTPSIGREFREGFQLRDLLKDDSEEGWRMIKELSVLISRRGVCFFRAQDITQEEMMQLADKIGKVTGKPKESNMCIHPVSEDTGELGAKTMLISAERQNKGGGIRRIHDDLTRWASSAWHSDVSFEKVPSDYSMLKINILPEAGGDTFWANGYDILDRMSPSFREYLETLTCEHNANFFHKEAANLGITISQTKVRGNPLNVGDDLSAHHPVIRTNPVTGWKALFVNRGFSHRIDGVTKDESDMIMNYINQIVIHNMDMQCRFRWEKGSIAIWDNRSTWHSATFDYNEERAGDRASSIGEVPYYDPNSELKSDALKREGKKW